MTAANLQVRLRRRPVGAVVKDDFTLVEEAVPSLAPGQVLVRNRYLSLDPYMRWRMDEGASYAAPVGIGEVMVGATVGQVERSKHGDFDAGDWVRGNLGWQRYAAAAGRDLTRLDPAIAPPRAFLGVLGMPGITAWQGLTLIGSPTSGETLVVSAAAGAVGSAVGQIARFKGLRTVGIAGGLEKCRYVEDELGFDACIDYKAESFAEHLAAATPRGVDIYFDNVGGGVLVQVSRRLNPFARIPLCGAISEYQAVATAHVALTTLLAKRVRLQGFIVSDRLDLWPEAMRELAGWLGRGELKAGRETIALGLRSAPEAFIGMLSGKNLGKQLVDLDADG